MSRPSLSAAPASTHLTKARKFSSVGLSGFALNMFFRLLTDLGVSGCILFMVSRDTLRFHHRPGNRIAPAIGKVRQLTHGPDQRNRLSLDLRNPALFELVRAYRACNRSRMAVATVAGQRAA